MGAMEKTRESIQKSPSIHERYPFRWVDKREEPSRLIRVPVGIPTRLRMPQSPM